MGDTHARLNLWIEAGRHAQDWTRPLEAARQAMQAEALGVASRADASSPWRLDCVGHACEALEAACWCALAQPQPPQSTHGDLCLTAVGEDGGAHLVSWRARQGLA